MPVYEYDCPSCGVFDEVRAIGERDMPAPCPACSVPASRTLFTSPALATMNPRLRLAHATNERSAHQPRSTRDSAGAGSPRRHPAGCACCAPERRMTTRTGPDNSKSFPTRRPWMISHY